MATEAKRPGLMERLAKGAVICAEGYVFELERRGYLQAGAFVPEVLIEHPEVVADRILNFAGAVGRDNVIAGVDCGFGTFAGRLQVDSKIVWMKLASLAEGARLASKELW